MATSGNGSGYEWDLSIALTPKTKPWKGNPMEMASLPNNLFALQIGVVFSDTRRRNGSHKSPVINPRREGRERSLFDSKLRAWSFGRMSPQFQGPECPAMRMALMLKPGPQHDQLLSNVSDLPGCKKAWFRNST